jgi:hypothetical protein
MFKTLVIRRGAVNSSEIRCAENLIGPWLEHYETNRNKRAEGFNRVFREPAKPELYHFPECDND